MKKKAQRKVSSRLGPTYANWQLRAEAAEREVIRLRDLIDRVSQQERLKYEAASVGRIAIAESRAREWEERHESLRGNVTRLLRETNAQNMVSAWTALLESVM